MDLKTGTRSTCAHCAQPVLWTGVQRPTELEKETLPEAKKADQYGFGSQYNATWRHEGSSWADFKLKCDPEHQDRYETEEDMPLHHRRRLQEGDESVWIKTSRQAEPVDYCTEQVEYYGNYTQCNRKSKKEPPYPRLCGLHLKPAVQRLREKERREESLRKMEIDQQLKEISRSKWADVFAKVPSPFEIREMYWAHYSDDGKEATFEVDAGALLESLGFPKTVSRSSLKFRFGDLMEHYSIPEPGAEEEPEYIPDWAEDAKSDDDINWDDWEVEE